jgi:hypothetical protein
VVGDNRQIRSISVVGMWPESRQVHDWKEHFKFTAMARSVVGRKEVTGSGGL